VLPAETVIIAGPTGAGKTSLAIGLAELLNGEIVGADAFQIYRGLPLLTAQPTDAEQARIRHHLVGSVDPSESYDAGRYLREALPILRDIVARGKVPLVVGGTGLYMKALLGGLEELPGQDPVLRTSFAGMKLEALSRRLHELDPAAGPTIDLANRRRVERALEIVTLTDRPLATSRTGPRKPPPGVRFLLVERDREDLRERIAANVAAMFDRGVEEEVAALAVEKIGPTAAMTLGLREIQSLLRGEVGRREAIDTITASTRRYAKRQLTWFRNQHDSALVNLSRFSTSREMVEDAMRLLAVG